MPRVCVWHGSASWPTHESAFLFCTAVQGTSLLTGRPFVMPEIGLRLNTSELGAMVLIDAASEVGCPLRGGGGGLVEAWAGGLWRVGWGGWRYLQIRLQRGWRTRSSFPHLHASATVASPAPLSPPLTAPAPLLPAARHPQVQRPGGIRRLPNWHGPAEAKRETAPHMLRHASASLSLHPSCQGRP